LDRTAEVKIEKVVSGGKGMGYLDGKVVFADYCAEGDTAVIRIVKEKKRYIFGEVIEIKQPSQERIAPECRYFGACGGCGFWHVDYETELSYKKKWFLETIKKIGGLEIEDVDIKASSPCTHYRNRVQFKVRNVNGKILFGFYKKGTNSIIDIDECLIANGTINKQIKAARSLIENLYFSDRLPQVDFTIDDEDRTVIMVIHVINSDFSAVKNELLKTFKIHFTGEVKPFVQMGRKSAVMPVFEDSANAATGYALKNSGNDFNYPMRLSPGSFLQVNYTQNLRLVDMLLEYLDLSKDDSVLDLFCGAGNFSFAASHFCRDVTGVENYGQAVKDAERNKERFKAGNVKFICSDVSREAKKLAASGVEYDSLIVDPPRQGAISALKEISKIIREKIVYISCDMGTFSRDAAFLKSAGFDLESVCLVDMFPRTHHTEIVSKFISKKGMQ
jgi:23S rRNA (uracil1939-C5)-methyltransferase